MSRTSRNLRTTGHDSLLPSTLPRPLLVALAVLSLAALSLAALAPPAVAQLPAPGPAGPVAGLALLAEEAGPGAWAPAGDRISYSRRSPEGYHRLYTARPDGTDERCLTCLAREFRERHVGEPAWHPSGELLVVRVARPFVRGGRVFPFADVPGRNLGDDLWYVSADGRRFGNLTRRGERGGRVSGAHFSPEGGLLTWSERVASGGAAWGQWVVRVAEWGERRGVPRLGKVRTLEPGGLRGFRESYGFTPDEDGIVFGMQAAPGDVIAGMELGIVARAGGAVRWLTAEPEAWDRFAALAPNGEVVVWASSRGLPGGRQAVEREETSARLQLDLWMMEVGGGSRDDGESGGGESGDGQSGAGESGDGEPGDGESGAGKSGRGAPPVGTTRLTGLNDPFSPEYTGRVTVRPGSWSRDGRHLLLLVTPVDDPGAGSLYRLELDEPYGF